LLVDASARDGGQIVLGSLGPAPGIGKGIGTLAVNNSNVGGIQHSGHQCHFKECRRLVEGQYLDRSPGCLQGISGAQLKLASPLVVHRDALWIVCRSFFETGSNLTMSQ